MNIFKKYPSVTNSYRQEFIDKVQKYVPSDELWVVQEKVHGANYAFYCDGITVQSASRNMLLGEDASFYSHTRVRDKYSTSILKLATQFKENIIVTGELCGGNYKGMSSTCRSVQKEVMYHPENEFIGFDIRVGDSFLPEEEVSSLLAQSGIPYCKPLFKGLLEDCLKYHNEFDSLVPTYFGLEQLENNTCEGVIIRPCKEYTIGEHRVILKNKNQKFIEKKSKGKTSKPINTPEIVQKLYNSILPYININRISSVASKEGIAYGDVKSFNRLLGLSVGDAIEEHGVPELEAKDRKLLNKLLQKYSVVYVKEYLGL
jgi:Rnl2 family RNA ligase